MSCACACPASIDTCVWNTGGASARLITVPTDPTLAAPAVERARRQHSLSKRKMSSLAHGDTPRRLLRARRCGARTQASKPTSTKGGGHRRPRGANVSLLLRGLPGRTWLCERCGELLVFAATSPRAPAAAQDNRSGGESTEHYGPHYHDRQYHKWTVRLARPPWRANGTPTLTKPHMSRMRSQAKQGRSS